MKKTLVNRLVAQTMSANKKSHSFCICMARNVCFASTNRNLFFTASTPAPKVKN